MYILTLLSLFVFKIQIALLKFCYKHLFLLNHKFFMLHLFISLSKQRSSFITFQLFYIKLILYLNQLID